MDISYRRFIETDVPKDELIISRTDLKGNITYANELFAKISGYSVSGLVGQPHSVVRHPDMPHLVFKNLWDTIKREEIWVWLCKKI